MFSGVRLCAQRRRALGRERRLGKRARQPREQPVPVHRRVPVVAAVEGRRELARRLASRSPLSTWGSCSDTPSDAGERERSARQWRRRNSLGPRARSSPQRENRNQTPHQQHCGPRAAGPWHFCRHAGREFRVMTAAPFIVTSSLLFAPPCRDRSVAADFSRAHHKRAFRR